MVTALPPGEPPGEDLVTTVLHDTWSPMRHIRDRFRAWCTRRCSWRKALHPAHVRYAPEPAPNAQAVRLRLPKRVWDRARALQTQHDARMRTAAPCRTPALSDALAASLIEGLGVTLQGELTCGGMSRIFTTDNRDVLVKISDVSRGWSRHEPRNYASLVDRELPAARVAFARFRRGYLVIGVERLHCTVASVIRSVAMDNGLYLDEVTRGLTLLLDALRASETTFCDLSPDNIMCRVPPGDLVLIDPQFAAPTRALEPGLGVAWASGFDTMHLALKIQAMGVTDRDPAVRRAADALCCALLGREDPPSVEHMTQWLLRDVPTGLRLAYAALQQQQHHRRTKISSATP